MIIVSLSLFGSVNHWTNYPIYNDFLNEVLQKHLIQTSTLYTKKINRYISMLTIAKI